MIVHVDTELYPNDPETVFRRNTLQLEAQVTEGQMKAIFNGGKSGKFTI
jgi:hypothetical protein